METVSFCLLPVVATGLRFLRITSQESAVSIGVLRPTGVMTATLTAWASLIFPTLSFFATASTG